MLLFGFLGIFLSHQQPDPDLKSRLVEWADYVAFGVLILPVPLRRVFPVGACLWVGIGFGLFRILAVPEGTLSTLAVFLVIHAAGAYVVDQRQRDAVRGLALAAGFVALTAQLLGSNDAVSFDSMVWTLFIVGLNFGFYAAAWALGDAARRQRQNEAELACRAEELAAERDRRATQAVTEERVRIARELHDVVAHHVSVMGVQAAAARHVLDRDRERARRVLANVEQSARQAVDELQRLVGILRSEGERADDTPQPTLDGLPALVQSMRDAGLEVELRVIGRPRPLPSAVQLSAYRIVQEALTNVMRHAPGARTTVVLGHLAGSLKIEVVNGPPVDVASRAGPGGGRGLLGMRERAAVLGGTFEHGPVARGGYRVAVVLPVSSTYDTHPTHQVPA